MSALPPPTPPVPPPPTAQQLSDVLASFVRGCGIDDRLAADIGAEAEDAATDPGDPGEAEVGDLLLSLVGRCARGRRPIVYVSVPITSGRAYLEWHARHPGAARSGDDPVVRQSVISTNKRRAREVVGRLREALPGVVIDPSCLMDVPGWEQPHYHAFWIKVIERHADRVIFVDGWQYSVGCTIEFAAAVRLGIPILTERLATLDVATGLELVRAALEEYASAQVDSTRLRQALHDAEEAATRTAPLRT
ncbi:MAG TPA: DUF4406 domain-containing protein [Streptosporangiaceae bacterium]|nr:DUF4406 domain-containing protein [Streptosporangiaceae bacterium]